MDDVVACPHLAARDFVVRHHHPAVGARATAGIPWRSPGWERQPMAAAPALGADTVDVLSAHLGSDRVSQLDATGALT